MEKAARHRAGLVPPRPARRRPRRALPRAQAARQVWCAFVFDRAILDDAAARRPPRRVHRRERRRARRRPRAARRSARRRRRAPARAPRRRRRRDRRARRRAARAGRVRQPRRRPVRARPRRAHPRRARRPRRRPAHVEGPRDLRAQRGADRQRQAVHACSRRTGPPGWQARRRSSSKPYPVERHAAALAPAPAGIDTARPTLALLGFVKTNLESLKVQGGSAARRGAARRLPRAHRRLRDRARVPGGQGPELPRRPPALRHDLDPPARRRGAGAHRRGRQARARRRDLALRAGLARLLPAGPASPSRTSSARASSPNSTASASSTAATRTRRSPPGARVAPAIRSSTRRWRRSTRPAGCTTGCAW